MLGAVRCSASRRLRFPALPVVHVALLCFAVAKRAERRNAAWIGFGFGLGLLEVGYRGCTSRFTISAAFRWRSRPSYCRLALTWHCYPASPVGSPALDTSRIAGARGGGSAAWTLTEWYARLDTAGFPGSSSAIRN